MVLSFTTAGGSRGRPYTTTEGRTQIQVIFSYDFIDVHMASDGTDLDLYNWHEDEVHEARPVVCGKLFREARPAPPATASS